MTIAAPANINEARRQAASFDKAQKLIEEGYKFLLCTTEPDSPILLVAVYKPQDAPDAPSYWIRKGFTAPEIPNGCDCPDYTRHGGFCKHTLAWELEEKRNEEELLEALAADYDLRARYEE